jgi:choline kinase
MKAIILAAGVGSRIRPLTDEKPKPLLDINGKTILQRMVDAILGTQIKEIIVATGYRSEQVKNFLKKLYPEIQFIFIHNEKYEETNTAYSLYLTRRAVGDDDFVKFDADVVFEPLVLKKLLNSELSALCIDKNINLDKEEVKVITDGKGNVLEVGKKLDPNLSKGESIGIEKIDSYAAKILFSELYKLMENIDNWQEYYDDSYTALVKKGISMMAVDVSGLKWIEIDTLDDYKKALEMFN